MLLKAADTLPSSFADGALELVAAHARRTLDPPGARVSLRPGPPAIEPRPVWALWLQGEVERVDAERGDDDAVFDTIELAIARYRDEIKRLAPTFVAKAAADDERTARRTVRRLYRSRERTPTARARDAVRAVLRAHRVSKAWVDYLYDGPRKKGHT